MTTHRGGIAVPHLFGITNDRKVVECGQAAIEKKMAKADVQFVSEPFSFDAGMVKQPRLST